MPTILKIKFKRFRLESNELYPDKSRVNQQFPPECDGSKVYIVLYENNFKAARKAEVLAREIPGTGTIDGVLIVTEGYSYCIGIVKDVDAAGFLASADIVELTEAGAITLGEHWYETVNKIQDPVLVAGILKKVSASEQLTPEEYDAIDPLSATKGVCAGNTFTQKLNAGLARMV